MSVARFVCLWCDAMDCEAESDYLSRTAAEARRAARPLGWIRRDGLDLCPEHAGNQPYVKPVFVLERIENPHPRMLEHALNLRRLARMAPAEPMVYLEWQGYLSCMVDATGEQPDAINAWMDRHDPSPVPVVARRPATSTRVDVAPRQRGGA